jgi:hypothetical protein
MKLIKQFRRNYTGMDICLKKLWMTSLAVLFLSACGSDNNNEEDIGTPQNDTTAPVLVLVGDATVQVEAGESYVDQGATATDNIDGTITANIIVNGSVETTTIGTYTITYNVNDASGNAASPVSRIVEVIDTTAPLISLIGDSNLTIEAGESYTENGASATDNLDGDISSEILISGSVDTSLLGSYIISYNVSDENANAAATLTRTVVVVDTSPPVISLLGDAEITIERTEEFDDEGASAFDNLDGDISTSITLSNNLNINLVGSYTINYSISDTSGNIASISRSVLVEDTTPPSILNVRPIDSSSEIAIDTSIQIEFSEEIDIASISDAAISLVDDQSIPVEGLIELDDTLKNLSFTSSLNLEEDTLYTATLQASITDLYSNTLDTGLTWQFSTTESSELHLPEEIIYL